MLSLLATVRHTHETVLVLEWQRGRVLALHDDGRLVEYRLAELRAHRIEAAGRIAMNRAQNIELLEQAAAEG